MLDYLDKEEREDLKKTIQDFRHIISDWNKNLTEALERLQKMREDHLND